MDYHCHYYPYSFSLPSTAPFCPHSPPLLIMLHHTAQICTQQPPTAFSWHCFLSATFYCTNSPSLLKSAINCPILLSVVFCCHDFLPFTAFKCSLLFQFAIYSSSLSINAIILHITAPINVYFIFPSYMTAP